MTEEQKKENDRKKAYLRSYRNAKIAMDRYEQQMKELGYNQIMPCGGMSDMPKAHNKSDLSDFSARLDELEQYYWKERCDKINTFINISKAIERMNNEDEKTVLSLHYIKDMHFEEIAVHMNYSWRQVHRIHARALQNFMIPQ